MIMQSFARPQSPPYPTITGGNQFRVSILKQKVSGRLVTRVALGAHAKKCLLLAEAKGVLGGLSGVASSLGGLIKDTLALLGGAVTGAGDGVGGLLGGGLLAGGLSRAGNVVGGTLDGVTSGLESGLLGVGLQAGGSLVGGALAAGRILVKCHRWEVIAIGKLMGSTNRASDMLKVMCGGCVCCGVVDVN